MTKNSKLSKKLRLDSTRAARTNFFIVVLVMIVTVIYDSGNLITKQSVSERWIAATLLLIVNLIIWYYVKYADKNYKIMYAISALVVAQIIFAGFIIYWERGMAATSTLLLALPIITIGVLRRRTLLLGTAALTAATYALVSVKYFNDFFNEGYRIQLWGNIVFYCSLCFIFAWMIMVLDGLRHDSV